jgi:hypothetical protein
MRLRESGSPGVTTREPARTTCITVYVHPGLLARTEWTLYVCDGCGSDAWLPEEVVHLSPKCCGKRGEELIHAVVLVPKDRERNPHA